MKTSFIATVSLCLLLFLAQQMKAQCYLNITDEEGIALPGVNVKVFEKESESYFFSDRKGIAAIPDSLFKSNSLKATLSFLGMSDLTLTLSPSARMSVEMTTDFIGMREVVVTGEYASSNPERAVHRIDLIDSKRIAEISSSDISDVLRHTGELQIQQNGVIGTGINIQGLGDRNVKVTINDVPVVGRVDGKLDLDQIDVQNIERIEIVKGPMAVSYGADAIAGVINIITKEPVKDRSELSARGYYSSEGQYDLLGRFSQSLGNYRYSIRGGRRYFDGWSPTDPTFSNPEPIADIRRNTLWNPKEQFIGGIEHGRYGDRTTITHRLDVMDETLKDRGVPMVNDEAETIQAFDDRYHTVRIDNALRVDHDMQEIGRYNGFIALNYFQRDRQRVLTDLTDLKQLELEKDTTDYLAFNTRHTWSRKVNDDMDFQLGMDGSWERSTGERIAGEPDVIQAAVFASAEYTLIKGLMLRPGIRLGYHELFNMPLIPSLALRYRTGQHTLRTSIGRGFRTPDFKELYLAFFDSNHNVFGNADLKSEQSLNLNLSHSYSRSFQKRTWKTELSFFYNDVDDLISLVQVGESDNGAIPPFSYLNLDEVSTQGVRGEVGVHRGPIEMEIGLGWTGREDKIDGDLLNPMNYFLQFNGSLSYRLDRQGLGIAVLYSYNGEQNTVILNGEDTERYYQDAFSMLDLSLSKSFLEKDLNLRVGVRNLLDVSSINAGSSNSFHSGGSTSIPISTGRNYFLSLDYTIDWNGKDN